MASDTTPDSRPGVPFEPPAWLSSSPKGQRMATWDQPGAWHDNPEGTIRFAMFELGTDEQGAATAIIVVKYAPGCRVEPHYHGSDYCSIVVQGSIEITRRVHEVGSMRFVRAGTTYGPLVAGPAGCTVIDVFATGLPDASRTAMSYEPSAARSEPPST